MAELSGQDFPTVIGSDASFKGELTFEKGLRLLGKFEGNINTPGKVHVAQGAKLHAEVNAGAITVEGTVKGNLNVTDRVELKKDAVYEGDLTASKLVVEEGASFSGHVSVGPDAIKGGNRPQSSSAPRPMGAPAPGGPQIPPRPQP